jgi:PqqD family protein of HPr-rel-A system
MELPTGRWRALPAGCLLWEPWEEGYAVFCVPTGETHLLTELPGEVLRRLGNGPWTVADLADALAADCQVEISPEWQEKVRGILCDLHRLDLIEAA